MAGSSQLLQQDFINYRDYTNEKLQLIDKKMDYLMCEMYELLKQKGLHIEKFTDRTNEEDDVQWRRRNNIVDENEQEEELKHLQLVFPSFTKTEHARSYIQDCDEAKYDGTPIYDEESQLEGAPIYDDYVEAPEYDCLPTYDEPADVRKCFPCWVEPACEATFKITLEVPYELIALSNMAAVEEKVDGNLQTVNYQESPIMSTYLVAAVVGLFDYAEDHTPDGVKHRVYCQVGKANKGKFALDVKTLGLYEEYFVVPYSLPNLDMIAIPDVASGAMENYGLMTYHETTLLFDDKHSAAANRQRVATVVAHELAHQWFGNLVTMKWWTHLWLNKGFATWVSYLATDSLFPEWQIWTQFLDESTEDLHLGGFEESHPIEVEINHACEINEIFDSISYRKGASVIWMPQNYLGVGIFQRTLGSYIKKYACLNAMTEDSWAVLEKESGEPVNKLMTSWTKQQGYPVVSAKVKGQGNLKLEGSFIFKKNRHILLGAIDVEGKLSIIKGDWFVRPIPWRDKNGIHFQKLSVGSSSARRIKKAAEDHDKFKRTTKSIQEQFMELLEIQNSKKHKCLRHAKTNIEASFCYGKVQLRKFLSFVFDTGKVLRAVKTKVVKKHYP